MKLTLKSGISVDWPRSPQDITLAQYIEYSNKVGPTIPNEVVSYGRLLDTLEAVEKELQPFYAKTNTNTIRQLEEHLQSGNAKDKTKRLLPPLISQWRETVNELGELDAVMTPLWRSTHWHPYQLRTVKALTGLDLEGGDAVTVEDLDYLFGKCTAACLMPSKLEYKQTYLHQGVVYHLPSEHMKKSTLIEFAEAAQYEAALKQAQGGDAEGLLKMCAVLLRPSGIDQYSESVFESNVLAFQTLSLQVAYEVAFFLSMLNSKSVLDFSRSTLAAAAKEMQG